jgi:hypothetical protein
MLALALGLKAVHTGHVRRRILLRDNDLPKQDLRHRSRVGDQAEAPRDDVGCGGSIEVVAERLAVP